MRNNLVLMEYPRRRPDLQFYGWCVAGAIAGFILGYLFGNLFH